MTKLDESIEESEFIRLYLAYINIPDKSWEENKDWPLKIINKIERICNGSRSTKLTPNIKKLLLKTKSAIDTCDFQIQNSIHFTHLTTLKFLIDVIQQCKGKKNKIYLSKVLLDLIFFTPGLYRDIILYHESLKEMINIKVHEFLNDTDGKYEFYKDYLQEYNRHVQNILLF